MRHWYPTASCNDAVGDLEEDTQEGQEHSTQHGEIAGRLTTHTQRTAQSVRRSDHEAGEIRRTSVRIKGANASVACLSNFWVVSSHQHATRRRTARQSRTSVAVLVGSLSRHGLTYAQTHTHTLYTVSIDAQESTTAVHRQTAASVAASAKCVISLLKNLQSWTPRRRGRTSRVQTSGTRRQPQPPLAIDDNPNYNRLRLPNTRGALLLPPTTKGGR